MDRILQFLITDIKAYVLVVLACLSTQLASAEGSRQLQPTPESKTKLIIGNDRVPNYATYTSDSVNRLYIHISKVTEKIYLGFGKAFYDNDGLLEVPDLYYRIKAPNGDIIVQGTKVPKTGKGFITSAANSVGPIGLSGSAGGYDPIVVENLAVIGDYYIEFSKTNTDVFETPTALPRAMFENFDITVGEGTLPKPGRLWAYRWHLIAQGNEVETRASFFVYTKDSVVTNLNLNRMQPYGFTVVCNQLGTNASTIFEESRKSENSKSDYAEFKIFLQDPDHEAFPSYKSVINLSATTLNGCTDKGYCIGVNYNLTKQVKAEVLIDFNKDGIKDPVDRILIYPLDKGYSCIPWDGKNGLGAKVPFGASFNITTKILTGLTNFPIFDPENNPQGLIVKLVRPQKDPSSGVLSDNLTPDPLKVYWDDTKIPGGSSNLQGCLADGANNCHRWVNNFGNDKTINTWWNVFNEETTTPVTNDPVARVDAGLPQKICYNGIGMSEGVTIGTPADPLVNGTYKWRATKGAPNGFVGDPTAAQPSIKLDNTTDDKVYFEVTLTVNGCTAKDSTYIEKRLNKGPIIVGFPSVCQGSQALTYKALDPLAKNHVWAITGGVITSPQGRDSIVVNWLTPGAGNIRVSTTYADCPPMSTDFAVDIKSNNLISPIPIGEIVVCQSATDVYVYEAPYSPNYKYFWNIVSADFVGDALDYIGNGVNKLKVYFNQDPSPNPSAVIKLRITNTDNGCFDATETLLNVKVNPRPNIVENTFQICSDDTTRIINPIGGRPEWRYQWAPTYGLNDYKVERPRFKFSTTYGDTIKYQVTATNQFNCSYTDTVQVNVYPRPTKIELTGRNFICKETETVYNNPPKEITYTLKTKYSGEPVWRILDKSADRPGINTNIDPNTNSVTVKWDTVRASNLLSYVLKSDKFPNNNQCVTRGNIEITYKKLIVFKPYGDTVVCINPGIGHYNAYSNGGSVYTWEALNGTVTNTSKPDSVDVQWDVTKFTNNPQGPYKLWVFQTNAEDDECKVEKEEYKLKVQLVDQTIITASADTSICIGSPLTVRAFPAEMGRYMTWTPKNAPGAPLIKDTSVYRYTPTQTTVPGTPADFEVTFDNGCKATENVLVNINPNPGNPILAKLITFCSDNQESDTIVTKPDLPSQGPYDYKWEPLGDFESITPSDSSSIIVNKEQPYTLTIYNTFGCFTFDTVVVNDVCPPRIFVPKAITPDVAKDPDKNDVLKIFGANFINFKMRIFNRWGEVIYETTDKNQSWDGTYNGEPVPFGVYPYVITYDSEYEKDNENPRMLNGSVTVIR